MSLRLRALLPFAAFLLVSACATPPPPAAEADVRLTPQERAEQVGRDVGAIVAGMRRAHGLD